METGYDARELPYMVFIAAWKIRTVGFVTDDVILIFLLVQDRLKYYFYC